MLLQRKNQHHILFRTMHYYAIIWHISNIIVVHHGILERWEVPHEAPLDPESHWGDSRYRRGWLGLDHASEGDGGVGYGHGLICQEWNTISLLPILIGIECNCWRFWGNRSDFSNQQSWLLAGLALWLWLWIYSWPGPSLYPLLDLGSLCCYPQGPPQTWGLGNCPSNSKYSRSRTIHPLSWIFPCSDFWPLGLWDS